MGNWNPKCRGFINNFYMRYYKFKEPPLIQLLFDYFHFHFQSGTLIEKKSFQEIMNRMLEQSKENAMHQFCINYGISLHVQLAFYLYITITEQLAIYQKQEKLHIQVSWLIKNWLEIQLYCI